MTPRHMVMAAVLTVAAWLALFGDKTPNAGIAEPVTRAVSASANAARPAPAPSVASVDKAKYEPMILPLRQRSQLLGAEPAGTGRRADGLFASQTWTPPPPPPSPPAPAPAPVAPPLPYTFIGKKLEGKKWEVYLARGEQIYLVHDKSIIEGNYRVDSIAPPLLSLTYLPLIQVQTLTIGGID